MVNSPSRVLNYVRKISVYEESLGYDGGRLGQE